MYLHLSTFVATFFSGFVASGSGVLVGALATCDAGGMTLSGTAFALAASTAASPLTLAFTAASLAISAASLATSSSSAAASSDYPVFVRSTIAETWFTILWLK